MQRRARGPLWFDTTWQIFPPAAPAPVGPLFRACISSTPSWIREEAHISLTWRSASNRGLLSTPRSCFPHAAAQKHTLRAWITGLRERGTDRSSPQSLAPGSEVFSHLENGDLALSTQTFQRLQVGCPNRMTAVVVCPHTK